MIPSIREYDLKDHSFTCILSHVDRSELSPNNLLDRTPKVIPPNHRVQVERPRFPQSGAFPVFPIIMGRRFLIAKLADLGLQ